MVLLKDPPEIAQYAQRGEFPIEEWTGRLCAARTRPAVRRAVGQRRRRRSAHGCPARADRSLPNAPSGPCAARSASWPCRMRPAASTWLSAWPTPWPWRPACSGRGPCVGRPGRAGRHRGPRRGTQAGPLAAMLWSREPWEQIDDLGNRSGADAGVRRQTRRERARPGALPVATSERWRERVLSNLAGLTAWVTSIST